MLTKGIIKTIDYTGNTCEVRMRLFETGNNDEEVIATAIISTLPGAYNGFKTGDVVLIGFERKNIDEPIVLGKLYLGAATEGQDARGTINCDSIIAENGATIPITTNLTFDRNDPSYVNVEGSYENYTSIKDIIDALQNQATVIGSTRAQLIDDGKSLGLRVSKVEEGLVQAEAEIKVAEDEINNKVSKVDGSSEKTFGWNLRSNRWLVYSSADPTTELDKIKAFVVYDLEATTEGSYIIINGIKDTRQLLTEDEIAAILANTLVVDIDNNGKWIYGSGMATKSTNIVANTIPILNADTNGLDVNGNIEAESGHIGKFNIGQEHSCSELSGEKASGIYSDNYIDKFEDDATGKTGIYIGTDGIKLGDKFVIDTDGNIIATSGDIASFNIANNAIYSDTMRFEDDYVSYQTAIPPQNDEVGVYLGTDGIIATQAAITGTVNCNTGVIGGFTIGNDAIIGKKLSLTGDNISFDTAATLSLGGNVTFADLEDHTEINTTGAKDFIIKNNGGAGIKFLKDTEITEHSFEVYFSNFTIELLKQTNNWKYNTKCKCGTASWSSSSSSSDLDAKDIAVSWSQKPDDIKLNYRIKFKVNAGPYKAGVPLYIKADIPAFNINGYLYNSSGSISGTTSASTSQQSIIFTMPAGQTEYWCETEASEITVSFREYADIFNSATTALGSASQEALNQTRLHVKVAFNGNEGILINGDNTKTIDTVLQAGSGSSGYVSGSTTYTLGPAATEYGQLSFGNDGFTTSISASLFEDFSQIHSVNWNIGSLRATEKAMLPLATFSTKVSATATWLRVTVMQTSIFSWTSWSAKAESAETVAEGIANSINTTVSYTTSSSTVTIIRASQNNNVLLSIGNFNPNTTNLALGTATNPWGEVSTNIVYIISDKNKKHNIKYNLNDVDGLFDSLKPCTFTFNTDKDEAIHIGFIAQDVEKGLMALDKTNYTNYSLVKQKNNSNYSLAYTEFIALNTDQIQKAKKRIATLEEENNKLSTTIESLEERLSKLEQKE